MAASETALLQGRRTRVVSDLGRNGCAALAERFGEHIEEQILRQYQDLQQAVPL